MNESAVYKKEFIFDIDTKQGDLFLAATEKYIPLLENIYIKMDLNVLREVHIEVLNL